MHRRGEDRLVEHVFPISGELLLGDDPRRDRMLPAAGPGHDDALSGRRRARFTQRQNRQVETPQRLHQSEAGLLVIGEHMAGNHFAFVSGEPDRFGFHDEVADRQRHAVADQHRIAAAFGAQRFRGERVRGHDRVQVHHRANHSWHFRFDIVRLMRRPSGRRHHIFDRSGLTRVQKFDRLGLGEALVNETRSRIS